MLLKIKENSIVAKVAAKKLKSASVAIVIGKTIHLHNVTKQQFLLNERWVKHEACHLNQFRQFGFFNFILKYLWESLLHGYHDNKYEKEARDAEDS